MKAVIIKTDNSKEVVEFDRTNSYEVLSGAVDGYIQQVPLDDIGVTMYVNEEGKIHGLQQNPIATALWIDQWGETDVITGNVICVNEKVDDDGYDTGLTDEQVQLLLDYKMTAYLVKLDDGDPVFLYDLDKETA
jgi:hypothetical protein